jgi:polyisoprenoid-binding protein YceI
MKTALLFLSLALVPASVFAKPETFKVDTAKSKATWEGTKVGGAHNGEIKIKSGSIEVEKNEFKSGQVEMDMASLNNKDITGADMNAKLVGHLKSDDFFSVEKHPTSTFKITKVEKKDGKTMVTGDLTIKGITKPVKPFSVDVKVDKKTLTAKGTMAVDRTVYDIKYRSLKFFSDVADKAIHDEFKVGFDITASK